MTTTNAELNRLYCHRYYQRVRADPERYAALLAKLRRNAQKRRALARTAGEMAPAGSDAGQECPANDSLPTEVPTTSASLVPLSSDSGAMTAAKPSSDHQSKRERLAEMRDQYEERAAIRQFDGELSRDDAEAAAMNDLLDLLYRLGSSPPPSLLCTPDTEARTNQSD